MKQLVKSCSSDWNMKLWFRSFWQKLRIQTWEAGLAMLKLLSNISFPLFLGFRGSPLSTGVTPQMMVMGMWRSSPWWTRSNMNSFLYSAS